MKRILIVLVIVTLLLCGCGKSQENIHDKETEKTQQRFAIEYRQALGTWGTINIIRDTETGKAYMFVHSGYAGGLTMLEEEEG